jgi:outer membrane protein, multidrug efflux system
MIGKSPLILVTILLLAGCTMAPAYKRPVMPVPDSWPKGPAYQAGSSEQTGQTPDNVPWRDFYLNERLRQVIDLALKNNRDLRITALNIQRAQALYRIKRADLLPSVYASGSSPNSRVPVDLANEGEAYTSRQYNVGVGITSWEIDFFGRVRSLKDQALQQYFATEEAWRSARIALIAEVAKAYLTLAADRENLKLALETLSSQEESSRLIERRFNVGTSSMLDVRQAQTRVEAARRDAAFYTARIASDENALTFLAGASIPPELLPIAMEADAALKEDIAVKLPSEVLLSRPDIMQAEDQLKAANAYIGAARAAFFPSISLTTNIGTASPEFSHLFTAGAQTWLFTPQISMPIFDPRTWAALQAVKAEREIAIAQYEKAIQTGFREVADALAQRGTIEEQVSAQRALVDATSEAYRLAEARYQHGIDSYLTVLDAQRSQYAAQQALIGLRLERLTNLVTLYKVLGGGSSFQAGPSS